MRNKQKVSVRINVTMTKNNDEVKQGDVLCSDCGYAFASPEKIGTQKPEERQPCPRCRSTKKTFNIQMEAHITLREMLGLKMRAKGEKDPSVEIKQGDNLYVETGKWHKLLQRIDRKNNRYQKIITDSETGEIIRDVDESLTDHQGYGSAKRKKRRGEGPVE